MLLSDKRGPSMKMAIVASESGFGNVTSFNTAFKEIVGHTPSQFRKMSE
jgi:AraC-like DNA-binding protein